MVPFCPVSFVKENWFYYLLVLNNKFLEVKVHFDLKAIESEDGSVPISPVFAEHRHTIVSFVMMVTLGPGNLRFDQYLPGDFVAYR
jgi:hypothetical protein